YCALLRHSLRQKRDVRRQQPFPHADSSNAEYPAGPAAGDLSPSENAILNEDVLRLEQALNQLSDDERIAIQLTQQEGWTMQEVATLLGRTQAAVGGLLFRGKRRLRRLLEEKHRGSPMED